MLQPVSQYQGIHLFTAAPQQRLMIQERRLTNGRWGVRVSTKIRTGSQSNWRENLVVQHCQPLWGFIHLYVLSTYHSPTHSRFLINTRPSRSLAQDPKTTLTPSAGGMKPPIWPTFEDWIYLTSHEEGSTWEWGRRLPVPTRVLYLCLRIRHDRYFTLWTVVQL